MTGQRRWPAEWESHEATWLSWPHSNCLSWSGEGIHRIRPTMLELTEALAEVEKVFINVTNEEEREYIESHLRKELLSQLQFFDIPTNDPWCRDHGPTFVFNQDGQREGVCWRFNSWGEKYSPCNHDREASERMIKGLGDEFIQSRLVLEPGGVDGNGKGTAMVSERSVIDPARNPGWSREDIEAELREKLNLETIIWVDATLEGDDTDGHVDNFARFVAPDTLIVTQTGLAANPQLASAGFEIMTLPDPASPVIREGEILPASYANFYLANERVILPAFSDPSDDEAWETISSCFPERKIIQLDERDLAYGLGGFHCATQQVPMIDHS
ncbi:MAG: agmatine deiminase family protein [Verrucomicrobiota bacterium]